MTINYDRINQVKANLEKKLAGNGPKGPRLQFFIPKSGPNELRIMPCWTKDETSMHYGVFFREVHQHWNITKDSKAPVLCSKMTPGVEESCAVCDFVASLRGQKDDLDAVELVKTLRPKVAFLINVVDLKDPVYTKQDVARFHEDRKDDECPFKVGDTKVQVYPAGQTVFNQILAFVSTNEQDLTDLETGHNVTLTKHGAGINTKYEVIVHYKKTKAQVNMDTLQIPDLGAVGFSVDNDKLLQILGQNEEAMAFSNLLPSGNAPKQLKSANARAAVKDTTDDDILAADDDDDDLAGNLRAALNSR